MKVVQDDSTAMSWITLIGLGAIVALGVVVYQHRDRFFPSDDTKTVVVKKAPSDLDAKFFAARDQIVGGKYDDAIATLKPLDVDGVPQPTRNWITFHSALAQMLAGHLPEARTELAKVEKRGTTGADPRDQPLTTFFIDTAKRGESEEPDKGDVAEKYDKESYESFALLLLGLKDWLMEDYDDGGFLLRQFKSSAPPDSYIWLQRYKNIAGNYAESFSAYSAALEVAKGASTTERKEDALKTIEAARAKLAGQGGMTKKLAEIEQDLKQQVATTKETMAKADADADAADQKIISDVTERVAGYIPKYQFTDAHQAVFIATVDGDKAKAQLANLDKRTSWLSDFKGTLVKDISAAGFNQKLTKKDGGVVPFAIKSADDSSLIGANKVQVPWSDLSSDAVASIAQAFLSKSNTPDDAADRKWGLGAFLYEIGKKTDGRALLQDAAKAKPDYEKGLTLFPE